MARGRAGVFCPFHARPGLFEFSPELQGVDGFISGGSIGLESPAWIPPLLKSSSIPGPTGSAAARKLCGRGI